jgi:hypothetical protein
MRLPMVSMGIRPQVASSNRYGAPELFLLRIIGMVARLGAGTDTKRKNNDANVDRRPYSVHYAVSVRGKPSSAPH